MHSDVETQQLLLIEVVYIHRSLCLFIAEMVEEENLCFELAFFFEILLYFKFYRLDTGPRLRAHAHAIRKTTS